MNQTLAGKVTAMRKMCMSIAAAIALCGCAPKLETGYSPRPLSASADDRRAYYAPEYTPEAHPAKDDNSGASSFMPH
jgi:hypothetical protein